MYIDSHAHFDLALEETSVSESSLIDAMKDQSIERAVQVGIDMASSHWSHDFARRNAGAGIYFTAGIHPSSTAGDPELAELADLVESVRSGGSAPLLFGIGECGLDFYRKRMPREMQIRSFRFQIELARLHRLPIIVHSRDAMEETLGILGEYGPSAGIMHCFSGDAAAARRVLDLGFHVSFAGNVTYRTANMLQEAASYVPLDRLLIETDAPFLTPVPLRGRKNRPDYVIHTYRFIAGLRSEPLPRIIEAVHENFMGMVSHEVKTV
ncbi:MAG TPA: TatD family hydrolase [Spirochaetota bacterium]|nr:TatD family hydrolase [Spirochaetota bacterium]HOD13231.1 TatD family hydrolase [Spirochaetota bacterium]HPG48961.1 TatD family hydrolase [Spirochaetota bacterium]HPN10470.1 TatD family hydrolase [Spirochaetota bacterium]HQL80650.1 TatD family hydrolase [Spirochaetota bacterium]